MDLFRKILSNSSVSKQQDRKAKLYQNLIRREAKIGGQLFGPIAKDGRREFFCLDEHTWVWHEEWTQDGKRYMRVTRYVVRPDGILKTVDNKHYQRVTPRESKNLRQAAEMYYQRVKLDVYKTA